MYGIQSSLQSWNKNTEITHKLQQRTDTNLQTIISSIIPIVSIQRLHINVVSEWLVNWKKYHITFFKASYLLEQLKSIT